MFTIELLPASYGDCIWIEYGSRRSPRRVLIDGGVPKTSKLLKERLLAIPDGKRQFELLVVTHIDEDHIGGALKVLEDGSYDVGWRQVWFNGWKHLPKAPKDKLGAVQGERLSAAIKARKIPWNKSFDGKAVSTGPKGRPRSVTLDGGLRLTLLGPTSGQLQKLRPVWEREVKKAGLVPGVAPKKAPSRKRPPDALGGLNVKSLAAKTFTSDAAEANGSSITFIAEFQGRRCVFGADAHPGPLAAAIRAAGGNAVLAADAFKVPHHGSGFNVSRELIAGVSCPHYLFSTSGERFEHPDPEAVSRVIVEAGKGTSLHFNYRSKETRVWESRSLQKAHGFSAHLPAADEPGYVLDLSR